MKYIYKIIQPATMPPFKAEVVNPFGHPVFNIEGPEIFSKQIMTDPQDIAGLEKHLKEIKILTDSDNLEDYEVIISGIQGSIFSNPLHCKRLEARMERGGLPDTQAATEEDGGNLDYNNDPEYIELQAEYERLLKEMKATDPRSYKIRILSAKIETVQMAKKRIALGSTINRGERMAESPTYKKRSFLSAKLAKGGQISKEDVDDLLESYEPPFKVLKRSWVDTDENVHAGHKYYWIELTVEPDIFKQYEENYKEWLNHFKNYIKEKDELFIDETISTADSTPNVLHYGITDFLPDEEGEEEEQPTQNSSSTQNPKPTIWDNVKFVRMHKPIDSIEPVVKSTASKDKIEDLLDSYEPPFPVIKKDWVDTDKNTHSREKYYWIPLTIDSDLFAQFGEKYKEWLEHFKNYLKEKGYVFTDMDINTSDQTPDVLHYQITIDY